MRNRMCNIAEMDDNLSQQVDEIEAMRSIYGEDFKVVCEANHVYAIKIRPSGDANSSKLTVSLQITMPPNYPTNEPPTYQLDAFELSKEQRQLIRTQLEDIYCAHIGNCLLFLWVEKIKEVLDGILQRTAHQSGSTQECLDDAEGLAVLVQATLNMKEDVRDIEILHGEMLEDRKSFFQAHLACVFSAQEVRHCIDRLKENKKIASATHNTYAYRLFNDTRKTFNQDCDDDGETNAGSRLLHLLQLTDAKNVLVVVTRWFGGVKLGPDRFRHINNVARDILRLGGFIKSHTDSKEENSQKPKRKGK